MTRRALLALGLILVAGLVTYLPGAGGPYLADDIPNLANNRHLLIDSLSWESIRNAATSSPASPYYRPLSMLSFALNYSLAGSLEPLSAKLFNIPLHLGTGVLVYLLSAALLPGMCVFGATAPQGRDAERIALFTACFWLLHPLFVSTVLYTVQRMSILAAMFTLGGCLFYVSRRRRLAANRDVAVLAAGIVLFTVLGFLSKENGALLPGFLLLIEGIVFRFRFGPGVHPAARPFLAAMLLIPVLFILLYLGNAAFERWNQELAGYYFTIHERFLTQFRALAQYAGWLGLLSIEPMGLYHDDFRLSTGLLEPPTTLLCLLLWTTAGIGALILAARRSVLGFGMLWFLWGHALESTVLPLVPVFEHRNYLPGFGLILALVSLLYGAMQRVRIAPAVRFAALILVLALLPAYRLYERVQLWSDEREFIAHSIHAKPESALTLLAAAVFLDAHGDPDAALSALRQAQRRDPREAALIYAEVALHCEHKSRQALDSELGRKLLTAGAVSPRTATARRQYVEMTKACTASTAIDDVLMRLYSLRSGDRSPDVAMISLYGIGAIHLHKGDHAAALAAWEQAVGNYRDGEALRPMLEELRRRVQASTTN